MKKVLRGYAHSLTPNSPHGILGAKSEGWTVEESKVLSVTHQKTSTRQKKVIGVHLENFLSPPNTLPPPEGVKTPILGLLGVGHPNGRNMKCDTSKYICGSRGSDWWPS